MDAKEFRIEERSNGFYVQRYLETVKYKWFLFQNRAKIKTMDWHDVDLRGEKPIFLRSLGFYGYVVDKLQPFKTKEAANIWICKLIEKSNFVNKIHEVEPCTNA